jgi:pimeloyl-ACP methyl ester carboxylesterase
MDEPSMREPSRTGPASTDADRFTSTSGGLQICFRTDGDPSATPMVLIAGLGQQLISWPQDFVDSLVDRGFYVIRHDNRDCGRSTRLDNVPTPGVLRQLVRRFVPEQYTLEDMAEDTIAVLDAVGVGRVHVVGMSMGGMIAQTVAARHPERTLSLISIFSNTGHLFNGWVDPRALIAVIKPPQREREANADAFVAMFRIIASAGFPLDETELRQLALDSYDRGDGARAHRGTARHIGAIYKSGDRTRQLSGITAATLVIHGDRDLMVHPTGGRATARAIPGARLVTIPGMGHDLPRGARPQLLDLITEHARQASALAPAV